MKMTPRQLFVLVLAISFAIALCWHLWSVDSDKAPVSLTPLEAIAANPRAFHGKKIRTAGYGCSCKEGYLLSIDQVHSQIPDGSKIFVKPAPNAVKEHSNYIMVEGVFHCEYNPSSTEVVGTVHRARLTRAFRISD